MITSAPSAAGIALALAPAVNRTVAVPTRYLSRWAVSLGGPMMWGDAGSMRWLFQPLLMMVASSTESELAKQIEYLKAENELLRKRIVKPMKFTAREKRLIVRLGLAGGMHRAAGRRAEALLPQGRVIPPLVL